MKILAIDTATDACSVALYLDGECRENHESAPRRHAEILLPRIKGLLSEAALSLGGLDALAFGRGPGAFTGVRIAAGVIQGLAFGADLPVVPVSSLRALAQGVWRERAEKSILAAFDARMGEVYWGAYRIEAAEASGGHPAGAPGAVVVPAVEERVCAPEGVPLPDSWAGEGATGWFGVGDGWRTHGERLRRAVEEGAGGGGRELVAAEPDRYPRARDVAVLAVAGLARGESVAPEEARPVYLRDRVTR